MAVSPETPIASTIANGVAVFFSFAFTILDDGDLVVTGTTGGVTTAYVLGVDYTVTGLGVNPGSINFVLAPANGVVVTMFRRSALGREITYQTLGDLLAVTLNLDIDRLWYAMQEISSRTNGSIRLPYPEQAAELPPASQRTGGYFLGFDVATGAVQLVLAGVGTAVALALSLASSIGASLVGWIQAGVNALARTVRDKLRERVSVLDYTGADPTGATSSAAAVASAITYLSSIGGGALYFPPGTYKLSATNTVQSGITWDARDANIVADTAGSTCIQTAVAADGVSFLFSMAHPVSGSCSKFIAIRGASDTPSTLSEADYARHIDIRGLRGGSTTITTMISIEKAAKSLFIYNCKMLAVSQINVIAKLVECTFFKVIGFSSTGGVGTYGLKMRSVGGTSFYSEGVSLIDCTIDNHELQADVADVFEFQVEGGFYGCDPALKSTSGRAFKFSPPSTTTLTEEIFIGKTVGINAKVEFAADGVGRAYNATVLGNFTGVPDTAVLLQNNAANITISGKFKNGSGVAIGVAGTNNNAGIVCENMKFDSTYTSGVVLNGANGADCVIGPLSGPVTGDIAFAARPVRYVGIPVSTANVAALVRQSSASNITGTFAVAATIASLSVSLAKGATGRIILNLSYSGANAGTQNVQVNQPAGMVLFTGSGYGAGNLYVGAASGLLHAHLDFYCTANVAGTLSVVNQAGNSLTINNQGYIAISMGC